MKKSEQIEELANRKAILSLPVTVTRLKSLGEMVKGEADAPMCEELTRRLDIRHVHSYAVECRVFAWKKNGARLEGRVKGEVEQTCVVSLKPVFETIDEAFELTLVPKGSPFARRANDQENGGELVIDAEGEDPPEEFEGDEIDVGLYAEEFFALALNDYPKADGIDFDDHVEDDGSEDQGENPFAALAGLKDKLDQSQ
ncbi:MAG: DUF177 domain-containing protein [Cohaesibacter sp.]|nr:DUF177 domain-containing protein [Cohaesibacter sp.]